MFPGLTTKLSEEILASATVISPKSDLVRLTGTTAIATINPAFGGGSFSGILFLVPVDGSIATTTAGNIAVVQTMIVNKVAVFVYSKLTGKWYPHALA